MKTGKKVLLVVVVVVVVLGIGLAIWGRGYYQSRYASEDYYTQIPMDYPVTPVAQYADGGEDMGLGVAYNLTAYGADGRIKAVEFTVYDPTSDFNHGETLPQPGTYLKVLASEQIVTGWSVIPKEQVPAVVLAKMDGQ